MLPVLSASSSSPVLDWALRAKALDDASESGDLHVVAPYSHGALVAVIDGLGHGPDAAVAAQAAGDVLAAAAGAPLENLLAQCHAALHRTRGAVISLASFHTDSSTIDWIGVGNVEGILFRADSSAQPKREGLPLRGGVVGYQMPPLHVRTLPLFAGDTLIFVTDGISSGFSNELPIDQSPDNIAEHIFSTCAKKTDDALVLVVRYAGLPT